MIEELPRDEVLAVVDAAVEELLTAAGVAEPPVDAIVLAQKHLGMVVCLDRNQPQRGRAQRAAGKRQIYLRPEPSEERHQWTVAHEIGEHLKSAMLEKVGIAPGETPAMAGESLANLFAPPAGRAGGSRKTPGVSAMTCWAKQRPPHGEPRSPGLAISTCRRRGHHGGQGRDFPRAAAVDP